MEGRVGPHSKFNKSHFLTPESWVVVIYLASFFVGKTFFHKPIGLRLKAGRSIGRLTPSERWLFLRSWKSSNFIQLLQGRCFFNTSRFNLQFEDMWLSCVAVLLSCLFWPCEGGKSEVSRLAYYVSKIWTGDTTHSKKSRNGRSVHSINMILDLYYVWVRHENVSYVVLTCFRHVQRLCLFVCWLCTA